MVADPDILRAISFSSDKDTVLSVYLNVDPQQRSPEQYRLALRTLFSSIGSAAADAAAANISRIQEYLTVEYNRRGRGLVMFSCAATGFWWAHSFMAPLEDAILISHRPLVRPLASMLNTYARCGLVHLSRERARYYAFHLGMLDDAPEISVEALSLQQAAQLLDQVATRSATRRLLLAGTEENIALFRSQLSHRAAALVSGAFAADANATPATLGAAAMGLAHRAAQIDARTQADEILTAAHKKRNAVLGLAKTLTAVQEGRAQHVVMVEGFVQPAYRYRESGHIVLDLDDAEELGSGRMQALPDAVDSVLRHALVEGIDISIVAEHAALTAAGSIAARTRF